ncbi:PilC/PilY family type IV pilus protein [Pseudomonas stutzeri]|nr:PilC/PilY family type IV pilus protein [Stutzerimonas stutzeri]MCQ4323709.1 PilC/PilY family type IV pilus protein [Stutzerimonas stutzeri]
MFQRITSFAFCSLFGMTIDLPVAWADSNSISQTPLFVSQSVPPLNMLVMGRDHKLYYEAYNDASDLDGDSVIDVGYKPTIDYYGYFDSNRCYTYSSNRFNPAEPASNKKCSGQWSGDYLNYLTTSRMDALRKVLYGGYRSTDSTTETVLERAYIPQDAHSWGKEYLSEAHDGYRISDYTPLSQPNAGRRHLFANTTLRADNNEHPLLRYIQNSTFRIWEWVSIEQPVAGSDCVRGSDNSRRSCGTITDHRVRVAVCVDGKLEDNCKTYSNGKSKPTGILHDFGEADRMYFGLLTGSYAKNTAGGTLRSNMASFSQEIDGNGRFIKSDGIVATINNLRTIEFSTGRQYNVNCGWITDGPISDGQCSMWGNPIGEMMYETMRYFAGASAPHSAYDIGSNAKDHTLLSLPKPNWISPYKSAAQGGGDYPACAIPVMTVISDINPSYDFKLPGSQWSNLSASGTPSIASLNVSSEVDAIWDSEGGGSRNVFIGESNGTADSAPTAKTVSNLSTVRGLSPEEPSKQGTYYSAGVARFGANNTIGGDQKMMTYSVALASPLPKIEFPVGSNTVTVVPFAKSVGGSGISATSNFQPTNQIVDYYVAQIANTAKDGSDHDASINGGRPYAEFRINYEDVEQGADHDMDAIALYTLAVNPTGGLDIKLKSEYAAGGIHQYMGYAISGTTKDGVYLEICDLKDNATNNGTQDKNDCAASVRYKLNTPPGRDPGWCTSAGLTSNECVGLPSNASRTFSPSNTSGATLLNNPLWYAAKYGMPKRTPAEVKGDPDNYFLVTNALTLKDQLTKAFDDIMQRNSSVTSPTISTEGSSTADGTFAYTTSFDVDPWSGTLKKVNTRIPGQGDGEWTTDTTLSSTGRNIKFARNGTLASFSWSNLSEAQQALLNTAPNGTTDSLGQTRVGQIRGSKLGDIVNSSPLLVAGANYAISNANYLEGSDSYAAYRSGQAGHSTIYVGANDGMLHAFDAKTGEERFAFIPSAVIKNLPVLTTEDYGQEGGTPHRYFVDGSPVARDVYYNGQWHKVLLGSLGAGGRSVFALDVTDPDSPELLWEFSNEDDSDMGYSVPTPGIFRLHNGDWAALVPNGYDSGGNAAVLFVLKIETGEVITKLTATPVLEDGESVDSLANGLSRLMGFDINNDGIVDYAYAGDLLGNLWRFDLIDTGADNPFIDSATAADFKVSFGGAPLYVTRNEAGERQPITAAPLLTRHPSGLGYIVTFGTGRYLTALDKSNTDQQSLYGIWDRKTAGQATSSSLSDSKSRSNLVEQMFTETTFNGRKAYSLSRNTIDWYDGGGTADSNVDKWGWYIDFPEDGERLVYNMRMLGNTQLLTTITPSEDPCEAGLTGTAYGINSTTGGATLYSTFDLDGDGAYDEGISGFIFDGGDFSISSGSIYVNEGDGPSGVEDYAVNAGLTEGRQTWRQLPTEE